jgi:tetratricopeptide (TPR) repeat protein/predicted AlkP superfamily phosphohydrolase/phosphomutase
LRRIVVFIVVAVAVVFAFLSIKTIGKGEVAVIGEGPALRRLKSGINFIRPFAAVRTYGLRQRHDLTGDEALSVKLSARKGIRIDCTIELELEEDKVLGLDRDYRGRVFDKLVRPLLAREVSRIVRAGDRRDPAVLAGAGADVRASINEKTQQLGIRITSLSFGTPQELDRLAHDLKQIDGVKVFILGLDGYDWLIADRVLETHELENIQRIRKRGAWGNLRSMEPLISPLIWTTMVTGVTPDVHGITDFLITDEDTGDEIPVTSSMRRVPALWNIASLFDMTCGFIGWFASFPAEEVEGFVVADRFAYHMFDPSWQRDKGRLPSAGMTYPEGMYREINPVKVAPEEIRDELKAYINGPIGALKAGYDPDDTDSNLRLIISAYRTYENIMKRLYPEHRPDLFGIYFEFTDSVGHLLMKYMKPAMSGVEPKDEQRYGDGMAAAYVEADRIIGEVMDMLDENTVLVILSDHGFKSGDMRPLTDSRMGFGQAVEWHRINGSIALYGSIIKPGYVLQDAGVMDVAPTVLHMLGLPVDRKMTGRLLLDAFDEAWVEAHPVRYTAQYDSLIVGSEYSVQPSAADKALKDKLVSLGYVAGGGRSLVNLANYYHTSGKFKEALEIWQEIVEKDPGDLGARIGMSNAYYGLGKEDMAIRGLTEVLEIDPGNLKALHSLCTIHVEQGRAAEVLKLAQRGLRIDDTDGNCYFNLGSALQLMGRDEEAAHAYRKAIRYAPDLAEAYANLAQIYVTDRRPGQALEAAQKAVDLAADKAEMHYVLGMALEANDRKQEALERYRAALSLNPDFTLAYIGASGILLARGKIDSVITLSAEALRTPSQYTAYAYDMRGTAYFSKGNLKQAARDFTSAVKANSSYLPARINLAKVHIQQGDPEDAAAQLREVLRVQPNHPEATALLRSLNR